ncbi:MAG: hypothetical protein M1814_005780 [Vezdaea aestivalis]|nr:MAG: hypothetical protein M1814_005780 [Vezdaea aestivalis]
MADTTRAEQTYEERRRQLGIDYEASRPYEQLASQIIEEERQLFQAHKNRPLYIPGMNYKTFLRENVKKRWVEQGIWNSRWSWNALGRWKHEEPLEIESTEETAGSETDSGPDSKIFIFDTLIKKRRPKLKQPQSREERQRAAERRAIREREREASRPFYQFVYQISKDRERIQEESRVEEATVSDSADINTMAYENVKSTWTERGIWNTKWGILPGMSWKHEQPIEYFLVDLDAEYLATAQRDPSETVRNGAEEVRSRGLFRTPSPAESNLSQASSVPNIFRQELPITVVSAGVQDGSIRQGPPSAAEQRREQDGRAPSHEEGQARSLSRTSLGPFHPSRVSKAPRKKGPSPRQQPNLSGESMSDAQPSLPVQGIFGLPLEASPFLPRRSKRLQVSKPSAAADT